MRKPSLVLLLSSVLFAVYAVAGPVLSSAVAAPRSLCGAADLPETGIQGDVPKADQNSGRAKKGYNCGLALVGHTTLGAGGRIPDQNANMAWSRNCAYVAGPSAAFSNRTNAVVPPSPPPAGAGVAVVDVSDPKHPRHIATLRSPGAVSTSETLNAVTTKDRAILVVGEYGNLSTKQPMDIYDVRDCQHPKLLQSVKWPDNAHNLTISKNARYVFGTLPVQVFDLDPLFDADPWTGAKYVGNVEDAVGRLPSAQGVAVNKPDGHEAWPVNDDGSRILMGTQTAGSEAMWAIDIKDWLAHGGAPGHPPVILSESLAYPGHSIRTGTIATPAGRRFYALHSDESVFGGAYGCVPEPATPFAGPAEPYLSDYTDPVHPKMGVAKLHLAINDPLNCATQLQSRTNSSSHYNDVNDENDARFAMVSMWNAGLRIFDIRNPKAPKEVAYFNPGDVGGPGQVVLDHAWGHIRYLKESGQLWFATAAGGFWVVELEPQVRATLALDANGGTAPALSHPNGWPARAGIKLSAARRPPDPSVYYCTLNGTRP